MVIAVEIRNLYHNREIWGNLYKKQNVHNKFDTIFKDKYLQMGSKGSFSHLFLTSSLFFFVALRNLIAGHVLEWALVQKTYSKASLTFLFLFSDSICCFCEPYMFFSLFFVES